MARPCFVRILLVSTLLFLFVSHGINSVCFLSSLRSLVPHNFSCQFEGFARNVMETVEHEDPTFHVEETAGKSREMIEVMDYSDPGPNTNPKSGYIFSPPPQG
ncbi:hypothetical protein CJ030_MR6G013919 [Morella rubra]|uniref:Transmembrane protein n=1 Tax=Morella rubra TaxID=262757 RepID=A0A6A1VFC9_9ROSI|nr:hypothetical protein CJ030_MR6G013919 [Morella rubra]